MFLKKWLRVNFFFGNKTLKKVELQKNWLHNKDYPKLANIIVNC